MDWNEGISVDGYHVQCRVVARGRDFRVRVITRKRDAGSKAGVVDVPSPLVFESKEEAEHHARYLMLTVKGVQPSGRPEYTIL